jgi:hypothetical protein
MQRLGAIPAIRCNPREKRGISTPIRAMASV